MRMSWRLAFCTWPPQITPELRHTVALDAHLGHARCVLAHALLRVEGNGAEAVVLLSEAVRLDQMLVDLVLEALHEHAATLEGYGPALALAGALWLRRGERARGVHVGTGHLETDRRAS